jgi:O-antigen/teichoic acid export membrane protein
MLRSASLSVASALQFFQLLRVGALLLGSVLLARSPLGVQAVGHFEAMLFVGTVVAFFWANGLLQGIAPVFWGISEAERPVFLFQVFALFGSLSALLCGIFWLGRSVLVPALTGLQPESGWGWYLAYLFVHLATLPLEYLYTLHRRPLSLMGWGALSFGGYVVALGTPVWMGLDLLHSLKALAALSAVRAGWCLAALCGKVRPQWQPMLWRKYIVFSLPLVLNLLVGQAILLFDGWLVGWYFRDETVFALYRYGSREMPVALALASGLSTALTARIAAEPSAGLSEMRRQGRLLFHRVFPLSIGLMLVSSAAFRGLFGHAFEPAAALFNIYLLLTISRVLLPNAIVLAYGHAPVLLKVGVTELALKVALGLALIRIGGLTGVAWSAVLAFFWEKAALTWYVHRRLGIPMGKWLDIPLYAAYSVALLLAWAAAAVR